MVISIHQSAAYTIGRRSKEYEKYKRSIKKIYDAKQKTKNIINNHKSYIKSLSEYTFPLLSNVNDRIRSNLIHYF